MSRKNNNVFPHTGNTFSSENQPTPEQRRAGIERMQQRNALALALGKKLLGKDKVKVRGKLLTEHKDGSVTIEMELATIDKMTYAWIQNSMQKNGAGFARIIAEVMMKQEEQKNSGGTVNIQINTENFQIVNDKL